MNKTVKTTRIEKKYKDKVSGEYKTITIDYAKVVDRLNEFRKDNPRSKIMTSHKNEDGNVVFKAYVWKDKSDFMELLKSGVDYNTALLSCDSEGTAEHSKDDEKKYEKLETIAVGRALALLGYAGNGDIASTEEMEAFEEFTKNQKLEAKNEAIFNLSTASNLDELKKTFLSLGELMRDADIIAEKDKRKAVLSESV